MTAHDPDTEFRERPVVHAPAGSMRGVWREGRQVHAFLGIPYAAPPVGDNRWWPPQKPSQWEGVRECRSFGAVPIQAKPIQGGPLFPLEDEPQNEDCLFLNVWAPAHIPDGLRPVIVWFHPGAFQLSSGSAAFYHGDAWAEAGAVFVTINSRLGKIGYLAHPELSREDPDGRSGNYGLLDQIAALRWVQRNIASFGGDPDSVTLFGVSSGASSISLLLGSPMAHGLFHRAIAESGGSLGPASASTGIGDRWQTLASAEVSGCEWAERMGATNVEALRQLSDDTIRTASAPRRNDTTGIFDAARPIIDGSILPADSQTIFSSARQMPVPMMIGYAANEGFGLSHASNLQDYRAQAQREHGEEAELFLSLYPADNDQDAIRSGLRANGHRLFAWQNWRWASLHAQAGNEVYYYRFAKAPPVPSELTRSLDPGAFHGASIFYSFRHFHLRPEWNWTDEDFALSATLISAWISFARHGKPEFPDGPEWGVFDPDNPLVMEISEEIRLRDVPEMQYLTFWQRFYERQFAMGPAGL